MLSDVGLLLLRVVLGLYLAGHGAQKLFGWFEGPGLEKMSGAMVRMRLRPAPFWAWMAGLSEFAGGVLTVVGLLDPLGPLAIAAALIMANIVAHQGKGFWAAKGGRELPLTNLAAALALALAGPGSLSLDRVLGTVLPEPITVVAGSGLVLLGVLVALLGRSPQPVQAAPAAQASPRQS